MTWTRLNYAPADPPVPGCGGRDGGRPPPELQVMNALGPLAKGLAFLMGKQPEEECYPRGFLGLEWAETRDALSGQTTVQISRVVEGSPAAKADIRTGDRLIRAYGQAVTSPESSVIYNPEGKISQEKLENPAGFWNNVEENTVSLFQNKGAFE